MTRTYSVDCQDCGIQTDWLSLDRAVSTWNTRAKPAPDYAGDANDMTDEQLVKIIADANLNFECIWPIPISRDGVMFYVSREASLGIHGDILKIARLFLRERQ